MADHIHLDPYVREVSRVEGNDGEALSVGVDHDSVAIYAGAWLSADGVTFSRTQMEELAHVLVAACWEAGENKRRMGAEVADGTPCDAQAGDWLCTEYGPHEVHLARGELAGEILHAWDQERPA